MAGRYTSPVAPAGNGKLSVVPSPAPAPGLGRARRCRGTAGTRGSTRRPRGVVVEDVLGAVAVVGVVVDDQHPLAPVGQARGGHGHVVEQAEPHRRGSAWRDGRAAAPRRRPTSPSPASSGSPPSRPAPAASSAASYEACEATVSGSMLPPTGAAELLRAAQVAARVDPGDLLGGGRPRARTAPSASRTPASSIPALTAVQPRRPLGVPVTGVVLQERPVGRVQDGHRSRLPTHGPGRSPIGAGASYPLAIAGGGRLRRPPRPQLTPW